MSATVSKAKFNRQITPDTAIVSSGLCTPAYASALESALGLTIIGDLLSHYPRRYEDRTHFRPIADVVTGESVTVSGTVVSAETITTRSRMAITKIGVGDSSGVATLVFFNQWFLKKQFDKYIGRPIVAFGKANRIGPRVELTEVEWELVGDGDDSSDASTLGQSINSGRIVPIYPLSEGVKQQRLRKLIWDAIHSLNEFSETLPISLIKSRSLIGRDHAVRSVHFPADFETLNLAKQRLAYEGLFDLQLALSVTRRTAKSESGIAFKNGEAAVEELVSALPFTLTNAQSRAIREIQLDMENGAPMNRLLQGDVGSGKTVVAMASLLIAVRNGHQAAIMAPTEILAEQHFRSISAIMETLDVSIVLLTGSLGVKAKQAALATIASGAVSIVVGTHALIQDTVTFKRLGLAVIDEQHRFGVLQRAVLRQKGVESAGCPPDVLVMTATPIPRTLTLTLYGDLDVTVLDELPPGRRPIKTHWKVAEQRSSVYESVRKLVGQGRQAYVLCALVSDSEKVQARAATALADHLSVEVFPEFKVGLLHGQMKSVDKELSMSEFRSGATQILVSTTVIEVGVDVPNASIMVIEDADRFGLAQLHQLRGRVGRGNAQSYCILIADPKSTGVSERLAVMERTTDGFEIAEADLEMRGPGEFFGTRQSGVELLPFAEIVTSKLIVQARDDANAIIESDPELRLPEHAMLRLELDRRLAARMQDLKLSN